MPKSVPTKVLARELGLTERRVQQLVGDFVLPPPRDGRHELERCREQYEAYRDPDGHALGVLDRRAIAEAAEAERLVERACAGGSSPEDITAASRAHQAAVASARALIVIGFRNNDPARHFALLDLERRDDEAMGALLERAQHIMAERSGLTIEQVRQKIAADAAALEDRRDARRGAR